jgi:uncharacterized protein (TIGR02266 family)
MPGHDDERDQRKHDREPVTLVVEYEGADDLLSDYTENLSTGGMFVATDRQLQIGTSVQLVLGFPGLVDSIRIEGVVRWTRGQADGAGAGIEFAPGAPRDELATVIARIRARDPKTVARVVRVLVAEDNKHVATLIHDGLKGSARRDLASGVSFEVTSAVDGREAIDVLRQGKFDALIVDIYLPVLDGARVIQTARSELGLQDLPIIAVSAGGDAARRAALEAGANMFLHKPMRLRQVIETIQRLLPG